MNKTTCFTWLLFGALVVGGLQAEDSPAATNRTPVGKWDWFTGPALTFNAKGAVTGARRPAVWFWTDKDKQKLQVVWGGPVPGIDKLTLSDDGEILRGSNDDGTLVSGARTADAPTTEEAPFNPVTPPDVPSPAGTWSWFVGPDLIFHPDGTITGEDRTARWSWVDVSKRQLKIDFGGEWSMYRDTVTLSEDGKSLRGVNNVGTIITGERIAATPADALTPPSPSTPAKSISPVGTWSWFVGPDLTFGADGSISGSNRSAHWDWTNEEKREFRIQWTGARYGLIDTLTLSEDGNSLQGTNNLETSVSGSRIALPGSGNK